MESLDNGLEYIKGLDPPPIHDPEPTNYGIAYGSLEPEKIGLKGNPFALPHTAATGYLPQYADHVALPHLFETFRKQTHANPLFVSSIYFEIVGVAWRNPNVLIPSYGKLQRSAGDRWLIVDDVPTVAWIY